jgi:hypothetical protein
MRIGSFVIAGVDLLDINRRSGYGRKCGVQQQ